MTSRRTVRGSTSGALARGAGLGVNLGIQILLAAQLPASEYAVVAIGVSLATVWAVVGALGLDTMASREIGGRRGDPQFARAWWRSASIALLVRSPLGVAGYLASAIALSVFGGAFGTSSLLWLGLSIPTASLLRLTEGVARGAHRTIHASAWLNTIAPLVWGAAVVALVLLNGSLSAFEIIIARVIGYALVAIVAQVLLRRSLRLREGPGSSAPLPSPRVATPWGMLVLAVVATSTSHLDTLLAGAVLSSEVAGSYALTARLASGVGIVLFGVNLIAAPAIAAGHRDGDMPAVAEQLSTLLRRAVPTATVLAVLIALGTVAVVGQLREGYVLSLPALGLLLLGQIVSVAYGPVGTALTMTSDEWHAVRARLASIGVQVALSFGAGYLFGQAGVALATLVGLFAWNALMSRRATERLGVNLRWSGR